MSSENGSREEGFSIRSEEMLKSGLGFCILSAEMVSEELELDALEVSMDWYIVQEMMVSEEEEEEGLEDMACHIV